jgi:hypothetical protein
MDKRVTCFLPWSDPESLSYTINSLRSSGAVKKICLVTTDDSTKKYTDRDVMVCKAPGFTSTEAIRKMADLAKTDFILLYTKPFPLDPARFALERMMQVCESTDAGFVYSGYYENKESKLTPHPVIEYQEGSLRDDFNFGSMVLYSTKAFKQACAAMKSDYRFAGLYDLRLKISQKYRLIHIPELLYTEIEMLLYLFLFP